MYNAKIVCDSISETNKRITTFELTYPRIIHSEFMTHRMFSRNSASSRAIPVNVMIDRVLENPFIPEKFPASYKGMQPNEYWEKGDYKYKLAEKVWLNACSSAIDYVRQLTADGANGIKVHKQIANRLLEPFMWHTVIITATEFDNFFKLRTNEQAQYEIRRIADLMYEAYYAYENFPINDSIKLKSVRPDKEGNWSAIKPQKLRIGEWHLPLFEYDIDNKAILEYIKDRTELQSLPKWELQKRVSVARCARVSYLTHDGKRDIEKDLELFERLRTSGHWSPFEHVATPIPKMNYEYKASDCNDKSSAMILNNSIQKVYENCYMRSGNFIGWKQWRQDFPDNNCTYFRK
jgi:thymidylate synthase ThyX